MTIASARLRSSSRGGRPIRRSGGGRGGGGGRRGRGRCRGRSLS